MWAALQVWVAVWLRVALRLWVAERLRMAVRLWLQGATLLQEGIHQQQEAVWWHHPSCPSHPQP